MNQLCNFKSICEHAQCMGPFIVGIAECDLCGYMERVIRVIAKRHPMNEQFVCGNCGQENMLYLDLRSEQLGG